MKDGSPQVTPTWIDIDKGWNSILINTAEGRIKYKNVSRDPRVAISVSDQNPYNMVSFRGRVIEQIKEGADKNTDRLAKKYLVWTSILIIHQTEREVILKIKPEKVFYQQPPK